MHFILELPTPTVASISIPGVLIIAGLIVDWYFKRKKKRREKKESELLDDTEDFYHK